MSQTAPASLVIRPPAAFTVPAAWTTVPAFVRPVLAVTLTPPATVTVRVPVFRTRPPGWVPLPRFPPVQVLVPDQVNVRPLRTLTVPPDRLTPAADASSLRFRTPPDTVSPALNALATPPLPAVNVPPDTTTGLAAVTLLTATVPLTVTWAAAPTAGMVTSYPGPFGTTAGLQFPAVFQFPSTAPVHVAPTVAVAVR